jgi:hypothetical protein
MIIGIEVARPPMDFPLRCQCGQVRGVASKVSPATGFRVFCYCRDCQAFAHFLQRQDVLDAAGGTDIFQMPPSRVTLTKGANHVRCVRLSWSGAYRWDTDCCRTPIGNTAGPRVPLIGVIHCFMDHQGEGHSRDVVLGPPLCRIYERHAVGPLPPMAAPPPSLRILIRRTSTLFGWWIRGLARPSPFFDDRTNAPCSAPRVLTSSERTAL